VLRRMLLSCAGLIVAVAGAAVAAPGAHVAAPSWGGMGTFGRSAAPSVRGGAVRGGGTGTLPRGGSGTLGQFYGRRPSAPGVSRSPRYYYPVPYYDGFSASPFFSDPFFYDGFDGFYSGYGTESYAPGYFSQDEWSQRGNVQLHVDPKDVEVIVDGIPSAHSGRAVLNLPSGLHHFEIIHPGYRPWVMDLDVKQGVRYRLDQRLERLPKEEQESGADRPTRSRYGELRLKVQPADTIVDIDGRLLGMADLLHGSEALRHLPLGTHTLRFSRPGYQTAERQIEITPDHPAQITVDLERE
jgi:hypothetical protein